MKIVIFFFISVFVNQTLWASEPTGDKKPNTCEIQAGWFDCFPSQPEYDFGCSVTCGTGTAVCLPAKGFPNLDPGPNGNEGYTRCNFFPSSCYCR